MVAFNLETAACVKLQVSKSKSIENIRKFFFKKIEIARYLAARIILELAKQINFNFSDLSQKASANISFLLDSTVATAAFVH